MHHFSYMYVDIGIQPCQLNPWMAILTNSSRGACPTGSVFRSQSSGILSAPFLGWMSVSRHPLFPAARLERIEDDRPAMVLDCLAGISRLIN